MKKELKFIHITKTGGTSIEDCGEKKGVFFGRNDSSYNIPNKSHSVNPWHTCFPLFSKEYKTKYDWFIVVRNPYDRIVSEFYCKWGGIGNSTVSITKELFNLFIKYRIITRSSIGDHYTEQHLYIEEDPDVKIHILKFENLKEEFDALMKVYNIDLVLDTQSNAGINKLYSVHDLSCEVISLINEVYKKDFEMFGYTMICPKNM